MKNKTRGSIILLVAIVATVTGLIAASVLALINTQRRLALRKELLVQAAYASEAAVDYAYSIIQKKIVDAGGAKNVTEIPSRGYATLTLPDSALNFLGGNLNTTKVSSAGHIVLSDFEVRIGATSALSTQKYIDPKLPENENDPDKGRYVRERTIELVSKATASQGNTSQTSYIRKELAIRQVPMFQHAIFFQGQLQLHRGFKIVGPIHTNSSLFLNALNGDRSIYAGKITAGANFFRGATFSAGGYGINPYGYTPETTSGKIDLSNPSAVRIGSSGANSISIYKETITDAFGNNRIVTANSDINLDSRRSDWLTASDSAYSKNVQDSAHEIPTYTPVGSSKYAQDVAGTPEDEFNNGSYSLIEPILPAGNAGRKNSSNRGTKLAAQAGLTLRIERNAEFTPQGPSPAGGWNKSNEWRATNRNERFVVKAYKWKSAQDKVKAKAGEDAELKSIPLPESLIGTATSDISAVQSNSPYPEKYEVTGIGTGNGTSVADSANRVISGLHDARLGRGVEPLTLDISRLKRVLEGTDNDETAIKFRREFSSTEDWNGVIYIEAPTSLNYDTSKVNNEETGGTRIKSYAYEYGSPELKHPDRYADIDDQGRAERTDLIVPIAPELRKYPSTMGTDYHLSPTVDLKSAEYAIPAIQVINAEKLPQVTGAKGFTLATNAPVYTIGSFNSDGNVNTGNDLSSTAPNNYATNDSGEIPAAIFSDTVTFLSKDWPSDRPYSFNGNNGAAESRVSQNRIEISASIVTGEYPVFEFFTHALQSFRDLYNTGTPPIVIKGSVIGMFKSEIQHVKQAYGRDKNSLIERYWNAHGSHAIPSVRFHQSLADGDFPPGAPESFSFKQKNFRLLRKGVPEDAAIINAASL